MMSDSKQFASESVLRDDLEPFELTDLVPTGHSCTITSILAPSWNMTDFHSATTWEPWYPTVLMSTEAYFGLAFSGFEYSGGPSGQSTSLDMTPFLPTSNPHTWYNCYIPAPGIDCQWQLDLAAGYIAMNQSWSCNDKNPEHP